MNHLGVWLPVGHLGKVVCGWEGIWPSYKKADLIKPEFNMGQVLYTIDPPYIQLLSYRNLILKKYTQTVIYVTFYIQLYSIRYM